MALIPPDIPELEAKTTKWRDIVDIFNKNVEVDEYRARIEAKNAKSTQNAVKTAKIGQKLREKEERDYMKAYGRPKYATESAPNPNKAFRHRKIRKELDSMNLDLPDWSIKDT